MRNTNASTLHQMKRWGTGKCVLLEKKDTFNTNIKSFFISMPDHGQAAKMTPRSKYTILKYICNNLTKNNPFDQVIVFGKVSFLEFNSYYIKNKYISYLKLQYMGSIYSQDKA